MAAPYYGTLAAALSYHSDRGNAAWGASTDQLRTAALVRASVWLDGRYRARFPGVRTGGRAQVLEWPRMPATGTQLYGQGRDPWSEADEDGLYASTVFDVDGNAISTDAVPAEIETATYEAALRELTSPGSLSPDYVASQRVVSESIGALSVDYADGSGTENDVRPCVTVVDDILSSLIRPATPALTGHTVRA